MPSGPDYHGWTHANGIDPIGLFEPYSPACRAYVEVASGTIANKTVYSPPFGSDGVFKTNDREAADNAWATEADPYTGTWFAYHDTGSGGSGSVIEVNGPGIFLLRTKWAFGFGGDTIANSFMAQLTDGGLLAAGNDDDTDSSIELDAHVYSSGGNIDPMGWSTDTKVIPTYLAQTNTWMGGVPVGQLRTERLVGLRAGGSAFHHMHVLHDFGAALPFDSWFVISAVRLGSFEPRERRLD